MLLIKIFEWHGVGQEAIAYTNNEVGNIAGTDSVSVYLYSSTKVYLYAIREMMKVRIKNAQSSLFAFDH